MSDAPELVERLRLAGNPDCWWAADKIEELRAYIKLVESVHDLDCERIAELEARLREEIMEGFSSLAETRQARYGYNASNYADAVLESERKEQSK